MAISQNEVIGLSILYANQAASASDLNQWATNPNLTSLTYNQAVNLFATSAKAQATYPYLTLPSIADPKQYVIQIFANAYSIAAADIPTAELAYWVSWIGLSPNNYLELPSVINQYCK